MLRRSFLSTGFGGVIVSLAGHSRLSAWQVVTDGTAATADVFLERPVPGRPHSGKVLAAIQPHADDIPLFAGGTVAKLIDEGYTGYLIRMSNDDMAGPGTVGTTVLENEKDNQAVARVLGLKRVFDLNYSNHQMDQESRLADRR